MKKRLLTPALALALGLGVWTLAVTFTPAAFQEGEVVSASALNDVINANFDAAKASIDSLESFSANLAAAGCAAGEAVRAVGADGTPVCAEVSSGAGPLAASVTRGSNLSVANGSLVTVGFDSEFFDSGGLHDPAVSSSRLTAPSSGIYRVSANITWPTNASGSRTMRVTVNGDTTARLSDSRSAFDGSVSQSVSGLLDLTAGDYVELQVFQDSGGALDLLAGAPLRFELALDAPAP